MTRDHDRRINQNKIKIHQFVKYLGAFSYHVLSWNKQIDNICSELSSANRMVSKLRRFLPIKTCISVYYSIYFAHLLYGCLVQSYSKQSNIDRISKLQKCHVKTLPLSNSNYRNNGLFFGLKWLKTGIFKMQKIIFIFVVINNHITDEISSLFKLNVSIHSDGRRFSQIIHIPKARTSKSGTKT